MRVKQNIQNINERKQQRDLNVVAFCSPYYGSNPYFDIFEHSYLCMSQRKVLEETYGQIQNRKLE